MLMWNIIIPTLIRHLTSGIGSVFVTKGIVTGDQIEALAGGAVVLATIIQSVVSKKKNIGSVNSARIE